MAFREFTYPAVLDQLGLTLRAERLYVDAGPAPVSDGFRRRIAKSGLRAQGLNTEKARSEFLVAPVLLELADLAVREFGLFSGTPLSVDPARGLNGVCDFLIARDPLVYRLTAPVLAVVEAKDDNVWNGYAQCIATMAAAAGLNAAAGRPADPVFGCSTTGRDWKFFRLAGAELTIDAVEYAIPDRLDRVAGIILDIVGGPPGPPAPTQEAPGG